MEPGRVARKVSNETVQRLGHEALVAEDGTEVRHPAYATLPTLWASPAYGIPGVDARISFSFEGIVKL